MLRELKAQGCLTTAIEAIEACIMGFHVCKTVGSRPSDMGGSEENHCISLRKLQIVESTNAKPRPCSIEGAGITPTGPTPPQGEESALLLHQFVAVAPKQLCHGSHRKTMVPKDQGVAHGSSLMQFDAHPFVQCRYAVCECLKHASPII